MFKFIKELKGSFNEGREEAKQEALEEERLNGQEKEEILEKISDLSKAEIFGCSLAAPFRASALQCWFTIFKKDKESLEEDVIPFPLFSFGGEEYLTEDQLDSLKKQLVESFSVTGSEEVLLMAREFLYYTNIDLEALAEIELPDDRKLPDDDELDIQLDAWLLSAVGALLTSGVQFENVPKEKALQIFAELLPIVKEKYPNWFSFSRDFIAQEQRTKVNGKMALKQLENYVSYLTYKAGSPWVMFPLEEY